MFMSMIRLLCSTRRTIDQRRTYGLFRSVEAWWQQPPASIDSIGWLRYWWYVGSAVAAYTLIISMFAGVVLLWLVAITSPITWPLTHSVYFHRAYSKLFGAFALATVAGLMFMWLLVHRQAVMAATRRLRSRA